MTDPVRARLLALPRDPMGVHDAARHHYTASSRSHHWNRVRCAAGLGQMDLYTATRHYFAWYALNVLEVDQKWTALQLGHQDGGSSYSTARAPDGGRAQKIREALRRHRSRPTAPPRRILLIALIGLYAPDVSKQNVQLSSVAGPGPGQSLVIGRWPRRSASF